MKAELPASIYRCKGIVYTDDDPDRLHALHVVGRRTELVPITDRRRRGTRSEIIAIRRAIDTRHLDQLFMACHASN